MTTWHATLSIASISAVLVAPVAQQPTTKVVDGIIAGADGVRLFYRKIGDSPQTIVMLHGGPGSNMNGVWPDLQPLGQGRTVVMYDQRGSGRSQILKDPSQLTAAHHVRDLEAVRRQLGIERLTLVGESWGSGLAVLYAAQYPEHVERLVLIGPMPPSRAVMNQRLDESSEVMGLRRRLAEMVKRMPASPDPVATCREFFDVYTKQFFADPAAQQRRRGSSCEGPPEGVRNYFVVNEATFASLGDFDFRPMLAKLTMPALVIEGDKSIPSTIESARIFARSLPNATLALIEGAGHYPQVEKPELFFPIVNRFLEGA